MWFIVCPVHFLFFIEYLISKGPSVSEPFEISSGSLWQLPFFIPWYHYLQQISAAQACFSLILLSHERQWWSLCLFLALSAFSFFFFFWSQMVHATCNLCQNQLILNCCSTFFVYGGSHLVTVDGFHNWFCCRTVSALWKKQVLHHRDSIW